MVFGFLWEQIDISLAQYLTPIFWKSFKDLTWSVVFMIQPCIPTVSAYTNWGTFLKNKIMLSYSWEEPKMTRLGPKFLLWRYPLKPNMQYNVWVNGWFRKTTIQVTSFIGLLWEQITQTFKNPRKKGLGVWFFWLSHFKLQILQKGCSWLVRTENLIKPWWTKRRRMMSWKSTKLWYAPHLEILKDMTKFLTNWKLAGGSLGNYQPIRVSR